MRQVVVRLAVSVLSRESTSVTAYPYAVRTPHLTYKVCQSSSFCIQTLLRRLLSKEYTAQRISEPLPRHASANGRALINTTCSRAMDQARCERPICYRIKVQEIARIFDIHCVDVAQSFGLPVTELACVVFCILSSLRHWRSAWCTVMIFGSVKHCSRLRKRSWLKARSPGTLPTPTVAFLTPCDFRDAARNETPKGIRCPGHAATP